MNKSRLNIEKMFDSVAQSYDKLNNLISFGLHKFIKKQSVDLLDISDNSKVLDLCTGTGDIARLVSKKTSNVIGIDFSQNMLNIARKRFPDIVFENCDCTDLQYPKETFDVITICYGLRNVENRTKAIEEIQRVLKPNGQVLHLDFGEKNFVGKVFEVMTPIFAKFFSKNFQAYQYLLKSRKEFPCPEELIKEFELQGLTLKKRKDFLFSTISAQIFTK